MEGDGNCGFYAYLGTKGKLQHSKRVPLGMPSAADYAAQQELRVKCVHWLQNEGSGVTAYQFGSDRLNTALSSWSPAGIESLTSGKNSPSDPMGVYANEAALRAMAALGWQNLVVINSRMGSNIEHPQFRYQPAHRVAVYLPGHRDPKNLLKFKSWACDIVPALLDPKRAKQYTVIVHNGDMPGSVTGHFDATGNGTDT